MIAEPLLARTDFAQLFKLIEPERKRFYQKNPQRWVEDVMKFAGLGTSRANEDILSRGVLIDRRRWDEHITKRRQLRDIEQELSALYKGRQKEFL